MSDIANKRRSGTLNDLMNKLKKYNKCALIRCTGFGKTWMLTSLINQYEKVLYLYPADVIKNTVIDRYNEMQLGEEYKKEMDFDESSVKNTVFMSYRKLLSFSDDEIKKFDYDLVIFDEMHRLGGKKTKRAVKKLFDGNAECHFVGATATPDRQDAFDVVGEFFNDICVKQYTLHDAFVDGIIQKPYYTYCTYDIETDLKTAALTAGEDINDMTVKEVLNNKLIEISKIYNMPNIIKSVCNEYASDKSYMKFITFFSSLSHLSDKSKDVVKWFKEAYPSYDINTLTISSNSRKESENVDKLSKLKRENNKIDLIFCVDMLNMGYHVNDLTGIVMYRGTSSSIIYNQQLGRALSSGNANSCIVFDVVDNLHRKAVYEIYDKDKITQKVKKAFEVVSKYQKEDMDVSQLTTEEIMSLQGYANETGIGVEFNTTNMSKNDISKINKNLHDLLEDGMPKWWKFCNMIYAEDLYATPHEATYRELIAKTVAEPISQRAITALTCHFNRWCLDNNIDFDIFEEESLKKSTKDDFYETFFNILKDNDINYPIDNINLFKSLFIGKNKGPSDLKMFAKWQNVRVEDVLDLLCVA